MAEYAVVIPVRVESFDWRAQGDEWVHRVGECLAEPAGFSVSGRKYDGTTKPFIEFTGVGPDGGVLDARLVVIPLQAGVFVVIAGKTEEPDEMIATAWVQAAQCATARLGSPGTEFRWTAVLAPPPARIGGAEPALASVATVGAFRLASAGHPLYEVLRSQVPSFWSANRGVSWPILVEAGHKGYNWDAASKAAAFELHRLSGLLSLAFGECLVVREAPAPIEWGVRQVPDRLCWQHWPDGDVSPAAKPRNLVTVPAWAADAWRQMQRRPRLAHAVAAFHEGLRAQVEHPSLALVAFIASVETVADLLFKQERCPQCRSHKDVAARFRATLRLVTDEQEAMRLGAAYGPRSLTVHQGRLHGGETMPGVVGFGWGKDPVREFEWDLLWSMRRVSRDLLRRAVRGELPTARVAFDPSLHLPPSDPAAERTC